MIRAKCHKYAIVKSEFLTVFRRSYRTMVGGMAQWLERKSLASELSLSCAQAAADG